MNDRIYKHFVAGERLRVGNMACLRRTKAYRSKKTAKMPLGLVARNAKKSELVCVQVYGEFQPV